MTTQPGSASEAKIPQDVVWVANFLRKNVPIMEGVSMEKRVQLFHGGEAIKALLSSQYRTETQPSQQRAIQSNAKVTPNALVSKGTVKVCPPLIGEHQTERAALVMATLLEYGIIRRAKILKKRPVAQSPMQQAINEASGKPGQPKAPEEEQFIFVVEPNPSNSWDDNAVYIWIYEGSLFMTYLYSFLLFVVTLAGVMYPLWPYYLRLGVYYLSMGLIGLLCLLFVTAIVRLILYYVLRLFGVGFWLFPNLFEDCGFFESFVPLYGFEDLTAAPIIARDD